MNRRDSRWLGILVAAAAIASLAGCNDNQLGAEKRRPNRPPQTILSSGPPDSTYNTSYRVHLFWSGSDGDGTIDHYDFILIDHPAIDDSIATGQPEAPHEVVVRVPTPDDPRWVSTNANDTLIVTKADTLRHRPPNSSSENEFVRSQSFERWHTFFVRAVDNEGLADDTPEYRSFNSKTIAPTVALKKPVDPLASQFAGPRVIVFNWEGDDPIGDGTDTAPIASRWALVKTTQHLGEYIGYPDTFYTRTIPWKPWLRWDAKDKSGVQAIVRDLQLVEEGGGYYMFAVQAMDEAGAVTPVFDAHTPSKNNVALIFVTGQVGPTLTVTEKFLGTFAFAGGGPVVLDIAAGQPVTFTWRADASSYGGDIVAYRYGWNIRNPSDDSQWQQNWCETCRSAPTRAFNSGTQEFFLETRDNAETVTRAQFELVVHQVTRNRNLLFIDDTSYPPDDASEGREDLRWNAVLDSMVARRPFEFDHVRDMYDVEANRRFAPPLALVFDYKTIVWTSRAYNGENAIRALAFFIDPFAPANTNVTPKFNYLNIYIENKGEFWLSGEQQSSNLWPISADPQVKPYPANLTNWDLPTPVHPGIDSAGVSGFFWKLGVEAVDMGGGSRAPVPRGDNIAHGCTGFNRATSDSALQTFTSTLVASHQHMVQVNIHDVEHPPAAGVVYTTNRDLDHTDHTHTVTLTLDQLQALGRGEHVVVQTSDSDVPQTHHHDFELFDQVGLWGAPAHLTPDAGSWPLPAPEFNRFKGRYNVEIYNMLSWMAIQTPPLSPPPTRWVALYNYESATRENLAANPPILYPQTADNQPSVILRKARDTDQFYSRALAGFEVWRLQLSSHVALASYILLRHFRLGLPDS